MQPIRNRMLKRRDSFILSRASLWDSVNQNHIPTVSFKLLQGYVENVKMIYDHASSNWILGPVNLRSLSNIFYNLKHPEN
jgi:hypothetical protein